MHIIILIFLACFEPGLIRNAEKNLYSPLSFCGMMWRGHMMLGKMFTISLGLARIRSHFATAWKPVSTRSGCALFRMMAAMAARSLSLEGADGISE
jgi:hypothetical protein